MLPVLGAWLARANPNAPITVLTGIGTNILTTINRLYASGTAPYPHCELTPDVGRDPRRAGVLSLLTGSLRYRNLAAQLTALDALACGRDRADSTPPPHLQNPC